MNRLAIFLALWLSPCAAMAQSPPVVESLDPTAGTSVLALPFINVLFNESVLGVDSSDLSINGSVATNRVDLHWLVEFTKQIDGYRLSNYFTKDRNGKLRAGPVWDWNLSFGNADYLDGGHTNRWYYEDIGDGDHIWLRRLIAGSPLATATNGDPDFTQRIADRWMVLRTNVLLGPRLLDRIERLSITLSNAAARDFDKYKTLGQTPGPSALWPCPAGPLNHDGSPAPTRPWDVDYTTPRFYRGVTNSIIDYLKKWVLGRYLWIDGQFTPAPVLSLSDTAFTNPFPVTITGPSGATIYYRTDGLDPPAILSMPTNRIVPTGSDLTLAVTATGDEPLVYQWQFNGLNLAGQTHPTLRLDNFQHEQAGLYNVVVYNLAGSAAGNGFSLGSRTSLEIVTQPVDRLAQAGQSTNFTIVAIGTGGLRYQWLLDGQEILAPNVTGANTSTLTITGMQPQNEGAYTCKVRDDYDTLLSSPATLTLISRAAFVLHPLSQTAVEGGSVTFAAAVSGTRPITFRWRGGSTNLTNAILITNPLLGYAAVTLTNLRLSDTASNYNVVASNLLGFATGGPLNGISSNAILNVLPDSDRDGIPDLHEPLEGALDDDGDGSSNAAEYLAGTDHRDPTSVLKLTLTWDAPAALSFLAVSNRTYTIQYAEPLSPAAWRNLLDILPRADTRLERVPLSDDFTNRFYRLITPIQR